MSYQERIRGNHPLSSRQCSTVIVGLDVVPSTMVVSNTTPADKVGTMVLSVVPLVFSRISDRGRRVSQQAVINCVYLAANFVETTPAAHVELVELLFNWARQRPPEGGLCSRF